MLRFSCSGQLFAIRSRPLSDPFSVSSLALVRKTLHFLPVGAVVVANQEKRKCSSSMRCFLRLAHTSSYGSTGRNRDSDHSFCWLSVRCECIGRHRGVGCPRIYIIYFLICVPFYISIIYFFIGVRSKRLVKRYSKFVWRNDTSCRGFACFAGRRNDFVSRRGGIIFEIDTFTVLVGMRSLVRLARRCVKIVETSFSPDEIALDFQQT